MTTRFRYEHHCIYFKGLGPTILNLIVVDIEGMEMVAGRLCMILIREEDMLYLLNNNILDGLNIDIVVDISIDLSYRTDM